MNIKNKIVIVTGASDGIGKATALGLAKAGANVLLISRDEKKLKSVQNEIEKFGTESSYYVCDLKSLEDIKNTVKKISNKYKKILKIQMLETGECYCFYGFKT